LAARFTAALLAMLRLPLLSCRAVLQVAGLHELLSGEADEELAAMAEEELGGLQTQVGLGGAQQGQRGLTQPLLQQQHCTAPVVWG
jgi:hypothetical protein